MPIAEHITVVIPVYNRADIVGRTLRSLESQRVRPAAIVLVDNNSTDGSADVLRAWARGKDHVTVLHEPRPGACAARNTGLACVRTDFVMFFDSDDEMLPDHVADFEEAIRRNPNIDIFGRDIITRSLSGRSRRLFFRHRRAFANHIFRGCLSTQRIVSRTSLVRAVGAWNETLPGWNDLELGVRLLLATDKIVNIGGQPSVVTYQTAESITGTDFSSHPERWEKSLQAIRHDLTRAGRTDLIVWGEAVAMILAARYKHEGAEALAASLRQEVLARTSSPLRMNMTYYHNRIFGRLTWIMARILFLATPRR